MRRSSGSGLARRWANSIASIGFRFCCPKTSSPTGQPKRVKIAGRGSGRVSRVGQCRWPRRQCLRASWRTAHLRQKRRVRIALRLSRLEVRRERPGHRHAGGAGAQPFQGQGPHQGVSVPGAQRRGVDLHGPRSRKPATASEYRMEPRFRRSAATSRCASRNATGCRRWRARSIQRTRRSCTAASMARGDWATCSPEKTCVRCSNACARSSA